MNEMTTSTDTEKLVACWMSDAKQRALCDDRWDRGYAAAKRDCAKELMRVQESRAQPASVADERKPVVYCDRVVDVEMCFGDKQVAHLAGVHDHPRLGDIPWARTSAIVSIETKNTVYIIGKAAAPQPQANGDEHG